MQKISIVHTADLHIGASRTGVKNGKSEIENTFFKIINICKTEAIDFLLIAGDLFDSPFVDADVASRVISAMSQVPDTIIAIAPGNHDPACPGSVYLEYKFPDNVVIFNSFAEFVDFPQKGVRLLGAGFTDRFERLSLINGFKDTSADLLNLCVLHGDILSEGSESVYNPISLLQIEYSNIDYLALGHIHKRSDIDKLGNTFFSYCGCPDGKGFDETGSHGIYMGTIEKGVCNLKYRELSSRQYVIDSVDIGGSENSFSAANTVLKYITNTYEENFDRNLYRISLTGVLPANTVIDTSHIQTILSESLSHITVSDNTEMDIEDIRKITNESSLRGIFASKMLERINSAQPCEKEVYQSALKIGLRAFNKGVKLGDN